tara:strand:+ start:16006 stop:18876 length:2871 start_codon:yes stop_codon:yes gene_type:complete
MYINNMASLRSDLTRRRSRNAGGIIPSWLKSRKLSDKDKAWKAHVESRVPYMRDLKNKLDQREKVCGDKESKKAKSIMKNLTKAAKLAEVSKFIKHLAELSKLIKEWDQRVITYATDLGKTCGMFTVVPEQSTIVKFIKERIDYENTEDPDNYTWEVRPELKPGIAVEVPAKPLRGPDGRFLKREGVERRNRDDIRRIVNRRVIDTRAEERAKELLAQKQARLRGYYKDGRRLTDSERKWIKSEADKYDIYNRLPSGYSPRDKLLDERYYPTEKTKALALARARANPKLLDDRYYPSEKKAVGTRALVKYDTADDRAKRMRRLIAAQARNNVGLIEDDSTRPPPEEMRRRVLRDAAAQAEGERIAARREADAKRVVSDAELGIANPDSIERIQRDFDIANQPAEDEKKKTSKPLVGNLGAQTEETENGPQKVDSGIQSEEEKKEPGLLGKAVGVVTGAVSGMFKSAEQKAAEKAAEDERLRAKLGQNLRDMQTDTQNLADATPLALSNDAAQPVRDPQPESGVDAALGDAFTSRGESNDLEEREARRKAREIAAETRERKNRGINAVGESIIGEVLAEDIPSVATEVVSEPTEDILMRGKKPMSEATSLMEESDITQKPTTMPPQPPTLPPRTRQFPPSSQKEGSPSPYSRPEKVDAEVQSVDEETPSQNIKHGFDIAAHETAAKAYEATKRREQNEASVAKRESLYEQDQLEMSKRVNEILDETVQNNAIEQQRAETAEEESDLNKALYESSQKLFEDDKSRKVAKDILDDVLEQVPERYSEKKERSQMTFEDAIYPKRKTSPAKTMITMSNPQSMPPLGPTEELRIPPGPTEEPFKLHPSPLRTRLQRSQQDRVDSRNVANYQMITEERKEDAKIALEKGIGFTGIPEEGTSPSKSFKPLETNLEDIRDSDVSDELKEDKAAYIQRWLTQRRFNRDEKERKAVKEAQSKPPFAG